MKFVTVQAREPDGRQHAAGPLTLADRLLRIFLALSVSSVLACSVAAQPAFKSTQPAPRLEYWQQRMLTIDEELAVRAHAEAVRLVFLGDSITDFWLLGDSPWFKGVRYGRALWDESFGAGAGANQALNIAVSGDRIEHVLHRILPKQAGGLGQLEAAGLDPDFVVLLIGINNSCQPEAPVVNSIVDGTRAVLDAVHARQPRARIVLQTLLPTGERERNDQVVRLVNREVASLAVEPRYATHVSLLDLYAAFVDPEGEQISGYYVDGLHPNEAGYRVWRDHLVRHLARVRSRASR